jgi:hypothetical protein
MMGEDHQTNSTLNLTVGTMKKSAIAGMQAVPRQWISWSWILSGSDDERGFQIGGAPAKGQEYQGLRIIGNHRSMEVVSVPERVGLPGHPGKSNVLTFRGLSHRLQVFNRPLI